MDRLDFLDPPKKRNIWQELIKTQSACVWGTDLSDKIPPFDLKDMIAHSYWIERELITLPDEFKKAKAKYENPEQVCSWNMQRLVRTGFEVVMLRERRWTRDLYPCFESFSKYYPEKKSLMMAAVSLALNPSNSPDDTFDLVEQFKPWPFEEIKMHVPYANG